MQDRIKKAAFYFVTKAKLLIQDVLLNATILTDNKAIRKSVNESLDRLRNEVIIKIACLDSTSNGFSISEYQHVKAKAMIGQEESKTKQKSIDESVNGKSKNPALFKLLKTWRDRLANEKELPHYMILPQKTMMELVDNMPFSMAGLKKTKGIGKKNAEKYGNDILEIIRQYRSENNMETDTDTAEVEKTVKEEKKSSRQISFELYKNGKTIQEIANERKMTINTVEGHLAGFVGSGEKTVENFVSKDKLRLIENYFAENNNTQLGAAKAVLGESVTWADLRFVMNHWEYKKRHEGF